MNDNAEILLSLHIRTSEEDMELLAEYVRSAERIILARRYPNGNFPTEFPARYNDLKLRIAEDMYNRRGASGQIGHIENNIERTWGAEWVSEQLLREIVPLVGGF